MVRIFPNLMKTRISQVQEAQRTPSVGNKTTPRHIIIELLLTSSVKQKIFRVGRGNQKTHYTERKREKQ